MNWIVYGLDIILIVLFVAGYAARFISPGYAWYLQLAGVVLPYVSLALVCVTAALFWSGQRGLLALHAVLCLFMLVRFVSPMRFVFWQPDPTSPLVVMTLNAKNMEVADSLDRGERLDDVLQHADPHVVSLQEVQIYHSEGLGIAAPRHLFPLIRSGSGYTSWPEEEYERIAFPIFTKLTWRDNTSIPPSGDQHTSLGKKAVLEYHGVRVAVYNVHLHSFSGNRAWVKDWKQWINVMDWIRRLRALREDYILRAREASILREQLEREPLPFIVCGDLNSTPHNWSYYHISRGFKDAFLEKGRYRGSTYPAYLPAVRIDYIIASAHWEVVSAYVGGRTSSDHRPLIAHLYLRPT